MCMPIGISTLSLMHTFTKIYLPHFDKFISPLNSSIVILVFYEAPIHIWGSLLGGDHLLHVAIHSLQLAERIAPSRL